MSFLHRPQLGFVDVIRMILPWARAACLASEMLSYQRRPLAELPVFLRAAGVLETGSDLGAVLLAVGVLTGAEEDTPARRGNRRCADSARSNATRNRRRISLRVVRFEGAKPETQFTLDEKKPTHGR